jgi:hypothetical protein
VVRYKPLLITAGTILLLVLFIVLALRRYIRRAIQRTQAQAGIIIPGAGGARQKIIVIPEESNSGTGQARLRQKDANQAGQGGSLGWSSFKGYLKLISVGLLAVIAVFSYFYYTGAKRQAEQPKAPAFEAAAPVVTAPDKRGVVVVDRAEIDNDETENGIESATATTSETLALESNRADNASSSATTTETLTDAAAPVAVEEPEKKFVITVLNGSGVSGAAARAAEKLKGAGYDAKTAGNADNFSYPNTIISYSPKYEQNAEAMTSLFPSPVELRAAAGQTEDIIVIVGKNYK